MLGVLGVLAEGQVQVVFTPAIIAVKGEVPLLWFPSVGPSFTRAALDRLRKVNQCFKFLNSTQLCNM